MAPGTIARVAAALACLALLTMIVRQRVQNSKPEDAVALSSASVFAPAGFGEDAETVRTFDAVKSRAAVSTS